MNNISKTLIDYLELHARQQPDALYARYIFNNREPAEVTFRETLEDTRNFAAAYIARGVSKGALVLVILDHDRDLMPAFMGAIWAGGIPAFLPPPNPRIPTERFYESLKTLIETSRPGFVLCRARMKEALEKAISPGLHHPVVLSVEDVSCSGQCTLPVPCTPEDLALIQYSSGSTGTQKGAALSHRAILSEISGVGSFFQISQQDIIASWVPLYHDWGLVCVALHALTIGTTFILMSPMDWITRPGLAFEVINRYRPTIFYQPNFAFNLMTQRVKDKEMEGIDLSSVRLMCNGAEPCFHDSHAMFASRFKKWGFRPESLGIVYGMAEVTNSVIAAGHREPILSDVIDRFALQAELRALPVAEEHPAAQRMLGAGRALEGTEFKIVDEGRRELPERWVGEVAIRSRACFHGYYLNDAATVAVRDADGWYFSGDMGYRVGNILFITGRKSDMIIVGGVNIYPQDIEAIVAEHPMAVAGRIAAIGVDDPDSGTQKIVLLVESRTQDPTILADIEKFTRAEVAQRLNVIVNQIVHVPDRWLIKTSSGKIARIPNYRRLKDLR
jgi:fatty-acyl-CoA synthase